MWFSSFVEKASVNRVNRRKDMREASPRSARQAKSVDAMATIAALHDPQSGRHWRAVPLFTISTGGSTKRPSRIARPGR